MERDYQGIFTFFVFALGALLVCFGLGYQLGRREPARDRMAAPVVRQSVMQGDVPMGEPVMVYWEADDGVIYGQSVIKTDYAGVLSFSVKAKATAYRRIDSWDYWTLIDPVMKGVEP